MRKIVRIIFLSLAVLLFQWKGFTLHAQYKIGSNPSMQQKSAILELESNSQGLLLTRVPDTNKINLSNPPDGMIIYFTDGKSTFPYGPNAGTYQRKEGSWKNLLFSINHTVESDQGIKFTFSNNVYTLHVPDASSNYRGLVTTGKQTFSGKKRFDSIALKNTHPGSVIFVRNALVDDNWVLTENHEKFYWNDTTERLGIGTNIPLATLDITGNFKLGANSSILNNILRDSFAIASDISITAGGGTTFNFPLTNTKSGANVMISPANSLPEGCIISYAYSSVGNIHIRIDSLKGNTIPSGTKFYVVVIQ